MVLKINLCASDEKKSMALEWRIEEAECRVVSASDSQSSGFGHACK